MRIKKIIVLTLALYVIIGIFSCSPEPENPRLMNGHTYLRTPDSVYHISFKIDSVEAMEYEPEEDVRR